MKSSTRKIPRIRCDTCDKELEPGVRALALEDSEIGKEGFRSLLEYHEVPFFCSEEHVLEHQIYEDSRSYQGPRIPLSTRDCCGSSTNLCVHCGVELSYGMRALRLTESRTDAIGFVPPRGSGDWSLFCSKHCTDEYLSITSNQSLTEFWDDLLRCVDRQSGMNA